MKQKAFTDDGYRDLVKGINDNRVRYEKTGSWLNDSAKNKDLFMDTTVNLDSSVSLVVPVDKRVFDYENAVRLHKTLGLTPVLASDPRLWSRLTHVECWEYMQERWPVDAKKKPRFIRERYFFAGTDSRAVLRNGISRLWWSAEVTHDPKRKGKEYELTKIMLSRLDIAQQLLERSFGRAKPLVQGFLEFVKSNDATCLNDGDRSRNRIRYLASCLHARSGVSVLDTIPTKDLKRFLSEELERFDKDNNC